MKNILVICSDQHEFRSLGYMNHPYVKTPNLDKLARDSVNFENAYCTSPVCTPSRMSFITGKYVHEIDNWFIGVPLDPKESTWARRLSDAGIPSTMLGKMDFCGAYQSGGFSDYKIIERRGEWEEYPLQTPFTARLEGYTRHDKWGHIKNAGIRSDVVTDGSNGHDDELGFYDHDRIVTEWAVDYLREKGATSERKPWALYVGLLYPHWPFCVPKKYFDMYYNNIELPIDCLFPNDKLHPMLQQFQTHMGFEEISDEQLKKVVAAYYGMITCMDEMIGKIIDELKAQGLYEDTYIIYTSDHGESLGKHGLFFKQCAYESSVGVPLLVKGDLQKNTVVSQPVDLVDMYPTIMEMAGLFTEKDRKGRSWLPLAKGEKREGAYAFSEHHGNFMTQDWYMLRDERYKYIHYQDNRPSLFDMKNDPDELCDLAVNPTEEITLIINEMHEKLQEILDTDATSLRSKRDLGLIGKNGEDYTMTLSYKEYLNFVEKGVMKKELELTTPTDGKFTDEF